MPEPWDGRPIGAETFGSAALAARIEAGDKDDLVGLIQTDGVIASLRAKQQLQLANHSSFEVPRALALRAPELSVQALRVLAKHPVFTVRVNLARSGGTALPDDVRDRLANDENEAVREALLEDNTGNDAESTVIAQRLIEWMEAEDGGWDLVSDFFTETCTGDGVRHEDLHSLATWSRFVGFLESRGDLKRLPDGLDLRLPRLIGSEDVDEYLLDTAFAWLSVD